MTLELMAFDRSMRSIDRDGNLYVERSNISKAQIRPYQGHEIPKWQELGLDPERVYRLLCPPSELTRAADSFKLKPLIIGHIPHSADNPPKERIIGTIGENIAFDDPYLVASLNITDSNARRAIESGEIRELSPGYYYRPEMTPGTFGGEPYDGVMRDIVGNHLALVPKGRSGPDVMVSDHSPFYFPPLKAREMKRITPRDWAVIGAVKKSLYGNMAMDSAGRIDLPAIFVSAAAATRPERLAVFARSATQAFMAGRRGLALDAEPPKEDDVVKSAQDADDPDLPDAMDEDEDTDKKKPTEDEIPSEVEKPKGSDEDEDKKKDDMAKDHAMALDAATKQIRAEFEKRLADERAAMAQDRALLREAEAMVRPVYGDMALDSADAVYDTVLRNAGIAFDSSFSINAKKALVSQHIAHKRQGNTPVAQMGMDAANQDDLDRLGISVFQGGR